MCQARVLAPDNLFIPCLAHKMDGKLMFCLCGTFATSEFVQRLPCVLNEVERSWIDIYTSIDIERGQERGYKILEFMEIWHYHNGGSKIFKDFILNIVRRKLECSGFPLSCESEESKRDYVGFLKEKCGMDIRMGDIRKYLAGRYLNKIMANSVWGKWAQNPASKVV